MREKENADLLDFIIQFNYILSGVKKLNWLWWSWSWGLEALGPGGCFILSALHVTENEKKAEENGTDMHALLLRAECGAEVLAVSEG